MAEMFISIPAPARGRTGGVFGVQVLGVNFNSRPREGANCVSFRALQRFLFQFPPPRGGERRDSVQGTGSG